MPPLHEDCDIKGCDIYLWRSTAGRGGVAHKCVLMAGLAAMLISCFLEGSWETMVATMFLTSIASGIFVLDLALVHLYCKKFDAMQWVTLVVVLTHFGESILSTNDYIWSSSWTLPFLLHYVFPSSTSTAFSILLKILPVVCKVFGAELLLIGIFSAAGHLLYVGLDPGFDTSFHSFITMFALSTSVNNPSCWMGLYFRSGWNALFFITFLLLSLFLVHCLVLGLVVKAYSSKRRDAAEKRARAKAKATEMAFACLRRQSEAGSRPFCRRSDLRLALGYLRPHYGAEKLDR